MTTEIAPAQAKRARREQPTILAMDDLVAQLEPLLRRIVREELAVFAEREPDVFYLKPDSPLYEDMQLLQERKAQGKLKFYSYGEVFGE